MNMQLAVHTVETRRKIRKEAAVLKADAQKLMQNLRNVVDADDSLAKVDLDEQDSELTAVMHEATGTIDSIETSQASLAALQNELKVARGKRKSRIVMFFCIIIAASIGGYIYFTNGLQGL
ncbi:MAG: hypothetical protein ABJ275_07460 [Maricaulaceae bacterium]